MKCKCGLSTRVAETRALLNGAVTRRTRECSDGHRSATFELSAVDLVAPTGVVDAVRSAAYTRPFKSPSGANVAITPYEVLLTAGVSEARIAEYGIKSEGAIYRIRILRDIAKRAAPEEPD